MRIKRGGGELSKSDNVGTHSPPFLLSSPLPFHSIRLRFHTHLWEEGAPATKLRLPPPLWGFLYSSFVAFGQGRRHENVHLALFIVWRKHPVCKKTGRSVICREALIRCLEHYFPRIYCLHIASRRGVTKESLNRHLSSFLGLSF